MILHFPIREDLQKMTFHIKLPTPSKLIYEKSAEKDPLTYVWGPFSQNRHSFHF